MEKLYYIGLDVHKQSIQYCIKLIDGEIVREGRVPATRAALADWVRGVDRPWKAALEATMFSAWIYDALKPHAVELKVAHSAMLKAITTSKHASDRLDARHIADLVRMDWIPGVWMAPPHLRALRLQLRYRNLVVRQATQTKNRIASTLMEHGVEYSASKLHGKRYFQQLLDRLDEVPETVRSLLRRSRNNLDLFETTQRTLLNGLSTNPTLAERVRLLETIPGVGQVTALSWALEIGDPHRFRSADRAMSYCGLVSPLQESAGKQYRQPLSKKRNGHLQRVLIEAAHLAPRHHPALRQLYDKVRQEVHAGAAVLEVARKLVSYLMAVDKSGQPFQLRALPAPSPGQSAPPAPRRSSPSRKRPAAAVAAPVS
jgi:transposase